LEAREGPLELVEESADGLRRRLEAIAVVRRPPERRRDIYGHRHAVLRSARTTPFTDSPRGARRRASAAAARLALPLAQVPLAGVGQHGHHELLGGKLRGDGARGERRGASGDAHEQALLAREP